MKKETPQISLTFTTFLPFLGYISSSALDSNTFFFKNSLMEGRRANQWKKPTLPSNDLDLNPSPVTKALSIP